MARGRKTRNIDTLWMGIDDPALREVARRVAESGVVERKRYCRKCGRRLAGANPGPFCFAHSKPRYARSEKIWREDALEKEREEKRKEER